MYKHLVFFGHMCRITEVSLCDVSYTIKYNQTRPISQSENNYCTLIYIEIRALPIWQCQLCNALSIL